MSASILEASKVAESKRRGLSSRSSQSRGGTQANREIMCCQPAGMKNDSAPYENGRKTVFKTAAIGKKD